MTYQRITLDLSMSGQTEAAPAGKAPSPNAKTQWNRGDFRIHARASAKEHWLVRHPFGRDLLVGTLQQRRPELEIPTFCTPRIFDSLLNDMVDELGMREWKEPSGMLEHVKTAAFLLHCAWNEGSGLPLPNWRSI